jgi:hypothetical protein
MHFREGEIALTNLRTTEGSGIIRLSLTQQNINATKQCQTKDFLLPPVVELL